VLWNHLLSYNVHLGSYRICLHTVVVFYLEFGIYKMISGLAEIRYLCISTRGGGFMTEHLVKNKPGNWSCPVRTVFLRFAWMLPSPPVRASP